MFLYDAHMPSFSPLLQPFAPVFLRLTSLLVWVVVAYSAVVFALQWGDGVPVDAVVAGSEQKQVALDVDALVVSKALGAAAVQSASASLASRFVLVGVMDGGPAQGVALISVDGKPAKPYRVGQTVSDGFVVLATGPKKAELGPQLGASSSLVLELPVKK
jgi:general secretion pathway protein C